jgi:hypothetical protein
MDPDQIICGADLAPVDLDVGSMLQSLGADEGCRPRRATAISRCSAYVASDAVSGNHPARLCLHEPEKSPPRGDSFAMHAYAIHTQCRGLKFRCAEEWALSLSQALVVSPAYETAAARCPMPLSMCGPVRKAGHDTDRRQRGVHHTETARPGASGDVIAAKAG